MSFHTFFGAIAVPRDVADPFKYMDASAPQFGASSRSGSFQTACRNLLNAMPGHETLRFLAGESTARDTRRPGGVTGVLLDHDTIGVAMSELDDLLSCCSRATALLAGVLPEGYSENEIAAGLLGARECRSPNEETLFGDEGESPQFFFSILVSLRGILRCAQDTSLNVAYFHSGSEPRVD